MNFLPENEIFNKLLHKFISNETLYDEIDRADSMLELFCLLKLEYERAQRNIGKRRNFNVAKILEGECSYDLKMKALQFALNIQANKAQLEYCINILNEKLSLFDLNLSHQWEDIDSKKVLDTLWLAAVIVDMKGELEKDLLSHLNLSNLKNFILKMCSLKMSKEFPIDKFSLFFQYYKVLSSRDPLFTGETLQYCIDQENLALLCFLFEKELSGLVKSSFFHEDMFWNFMKIHIVSENSLRKKQVEYILSICIEYLKTHSVLVPKALESESLKNWDFFFIILEMSREKQLHLVQPTMKLLPIISKLDISWQRCLYQQLLKHSQTTIVYDTVKHLFKYEYTYDKINQEIIGDMLKALNKFEYSHMSKEVFIQFNIFCEKLSENCYQMILDEFLKIDWNPASAWSVLRSISRVLRKCPQELLTKMLLCLNKLPHICIKKSCTMLFIQEVLRNSVDILANLIIIGRFLFSTNQELDRDMLYYIVQENRKDLENFTDRLEDIAVISAENQNLEDLIISLELMTQMNITLKNKSIISYTSSGDIILFYYPQILTPLEMQNHVIERFLNVNEFDKKYFLKLLKMLDLDQVRIPNEKCSNIWQVSESDKDVRFFVSYLICRSSEIDSVISREAESFLESFKFQTMQFQIENYRELKGKQRFNDEINELLQKLLVLEMDDENNLEMIIENLDLVIEGITAKSNVSILILDRCIRKLYTLQNSLMKKYSNIFFRSVFSLKLFSNPKFVVCWEKWCRELFDFSFMDCESLNKIILEGCRNIILLEASFSYLFTPLILKAFTKGIVVNKNQRVEYAICQEIHDSLNVAFVENPNVISSEMKMLSMECLYLLAKSEYYRNPSADHLMEMLVTLYMEHYNKRYFPDSKIHLEKLRIIQAMLLIANLTEKPNDKLFQFIMKSLSEESHQPSVKQLLQWLLLISASGIESNMRLMIQKVKSANVSNPSFIVALIPVLFHLITSSEDEKLWLEVTEALLPLLMGANFKLRLYSQVTLLNILKRSKNKPFAIYTNMFSYLEKSICSVLDDTGKSVQETLKNDLCFIENFDMDLHYSVENIFVILPQMLDVPPYEWQNVLQHRFSEQFDISIKTENMLPYRIHHNINAEKNDPVYSVNVQKKIIPWKQDLEDKINENSLGDLICVASLVEKNSNIGGLSRTCEIYNVKQLVLHNIKIKDDKEFKSLSMSSENWVDFIEVKRDDLSHLLIKLRRDGYSIVGLEQTSESVKLNEFKFEKKSVLLLGNEKEGIPAPLLPLLDTCVEIPQFGQTRSLNVHVAGATFIWEYVKQHMLSTCK